MESAFLTPALIGVAMLGGVAIGIGFERSKGHGLPSGRRAPAAQWGLNVLVVAAGALVLLPPLLTRSYAQILIVAVSVAAPVVLLLLGFARRPVGPRWLFVAFAILGSWIVFGLLYLYCAQTGETFTNWGTEQSNWPLTALYLSAQTLVTLGYGDVAPMSALPRFVAMAQMLTSLVLLSVALQVAVARGLSHKEAGDHKCHECRRKAEATAGLSSKEQRAESASDHEH